MGLRLKAKALAKQMGMEGRETEARANGACAQSRSALKHVVLENPSLRFLLIWALSKDP